MDTVVQVRRRKILYFFLAGMFFTFFITTLLGIYLSAKQLDEIKVIAEDHDNPDSDVPQDHVRQDLKHFIHNNWRLR